jgi:hypothetical protein
MSVEQVLESWKNHVPPVVPLADVLLVVKAKFERLLPPDGGHYRVFDSRLLRFQNMAPGYTNECLNGTFHIPTLSGRKVKGRYVKRILSLLEIVEQMTERGY